MTDDEVVAQILLGEGAGEGPEGLGFIRDVMVNRARKAGKTLREVATAPKQFSAYSRPDLAEFVAKQPWVLREAARMMAREAMSPHYEPKYPDVTQYEAKQFWDKRNQKPPTHWYHAMEQAYTIGNHVALRPKKK